VSLLAEYALKDTATSFYANSGINRPTGAYAVEFFDNNTDATYALEDQTGTKLGDLFQIAAGDDGTGGALALINDNLDGTISDLPQGSDYTPARAAKLDNLDAAISSRQPSGSTGAGVLTVTVTVSAVPVAAVVCTLRDSVSKAYLGNGTTDANGRVVFAHAGGTLEVSALRAGYSFAVATTSLLGAAQVATQAVTGSVVTLTPSSDPALCIVQTTLRAPDGTARTGVNGTIRLATTPQDYSGNLIEGTEVNSTSSDTGVISFEVPQGAECVVLIPNFCPPTTITIPASGAVDLTSLV
jgi:hypothetical protein